jgi:hypothetical protein
MRDPEVDRLLTDVRKAVVAARSGGAAVRACIFDATSAAVDGEVRGWPSTEARKTADDACRAVDPPTAMPDPRPRPKPPAAARLLSNLANWLASRSEGKV